MRGGLVMGAKSGERHCNRPWNTSRKCIPKLGSVRGRTEGHPTDLVAHPLNKRFHRRNLHEVPRLAGMSPELQRGRGAVIVHPGYRTEGTFAVKGPNSYNSYRKEIKLLACGLV